MQDVRQNERPSTCPEDAAGVPAFRSRPRGIKVATAVAAGAAVVGVGIAVARSVRHWFIKPPPDGLIETVCIRRASLDVGAEVLPKAAITEDLDVSTYEVTVDAYLACVRAGACESTQSNPLHGGEERRALCNETIPARGRHPINCVTLENARAFCGWVGMRVPTDVEWDYLACGNDGRPFPWGYTHPKDGALANLPLLPGESGDPPKGTMPVGSYANGKGWAGLFDLGGNVSEWTVTASCGTKNCREESPWYIKGGSWVSASDLACGSRASYSMGSDDAGVRCVRTTQAHAGCLDPPMGPMGPSNVHFAAAGPVVQVPGGDFDMGSDLEELSRPVHRVHVAPFVITATKITQEAYRRCVDAGSCPGDGLALKDDRANMPALVFWPEPERFCRWAGMRLPTEEEWEFAARGTDGRRYPWGNEPPLHQGCWQLSTGWPDEKLEGPCPVGTHPADKSPFGLLDMAGIVPEWTGSFFCTYDRKRCTTQRVHRGNGGLMRDTMKALATHRKVIDPSDTGASFRCAYGP